MRLYFDTNVYSFIHAVGERNAVARFLRNQKHSVRASSCNLFEILAISDAEKRRNECSTLIKVATRFEEVPQSWLHAQEVLGEIRRCRPDWLRRGSLEAQSVCKYLREHKRRWSMIQKSIFPNRQEYASMRQRLEISNDHRQLQKDLRRIMLDESDRQFETYLDDPSNAWRIGCWSVWHQAIYVGNPRSRDYCDWLSPYVDESRFNGNSYFDFWMKDVLADNVPRNRITELVAYYQLRRKITHGNANDQNHASQLLDVDWFLTCDQAYFHTLADAAIEFPNAGKPALLVRSAESAVDQLQSVLGS